VLSGKASLWDLLELDPANGGYGWKSDRGKVLTLLDSETLYKVSGWLDERTTEALERDECGRYAGLCYEVRTVAWLTSLPPDAPLLPAQGGGISPFRFVGYYVGSGRRKDLTKVVELDRLRRASRHYSERDLATALDIPRTTLQQMIQRMDEIRFSSEEFTPDDMAYVAFGRRRGREHNPDSF